MEKVSSKGVQHLLSFWCCGCVLICLLDLGLAFLRNRIALFSECVVFRIRDNIFSQRFLLLVVFNGHGIFKPPGGISRLSQRILEAKAWELKA